MTRLAIIILAVALSGCVSTQEQQQQAATGPGLASRISAAVDDFNDGVQRSRYGLRTRAEEDRACREWTGEAPGGPKYYACRMQFEQNNAMVKGAAASRSVAGPQTTECYTTLPGRVQCDSR